MLTTDDTISHLEAFTKLMVSFSARWPSSRACLGGVCVSNGNPWFAGVTLGLDWSIDVTVSEGPGEHAIRVTQKFVRVADPDRIIRWIEKVGALFDSGAL
jgi:hypothetical protein